MTDLADGVRGAMKDDREIYAFPIPAALQTDRFKHTYVGMHLLNVDEELNASKLGAYDVVKTQYEAAKLAICEIDNVRVHNGEGVIDSFWERGGPKMRTLLLRAYQKIAGATAEDERAFFDGMKVKVA